METSPLYKAAFHQRRAERHLKHNRFDEAIFSLEEGLQYTAKAYKEIQDTSALKVVAVLEDEYKRQIERIKLQKIYYEGHKNAQNEQKVSVAEEAVEYTNPSNLETNANELKLVIDKTMQDFDAKYSNKQISILKNMVKNVPKNENQNVKFVEDSYDDLDVDLPPLELPSFDFSSFRKPDS